MQQVRSKKQLETTYLVQQKMLYHNSSQVSKNCTDQGDSAPIEALIFQKEPPRGMEGGYHAENSAIDPQDRFAKREFGENQNSAFSRRINLVFCAKCFWCASYLHSSVQRDMSCPYCDARDMEAIPLAICSTA